MTIEDQIADLYKQVAEIKDVLKAMVQVSPTTTDHKHEYIVPSNIREQTIVTLKTSGVR